MSLFRSRVNSAVPPTGRNVRGEFCFKCGLGVKGGAGGALLAPDWPRDAPDSYCVKFGRGFVLARPT